MTSAGRSLTPAFSDSPFCCQLPLDTVHSNGDHRLSDSCPPPPTSHLGLELPLLPELRERGTLPSARAAPSSGRGRHFQCGCQLRPQAALLWPKRFIFYFSNANFIYPVWFKEPRDLYFTAFPGVPAGNWVRRGAAGTPTCPRVGWLFHKQKLYWLCHQTGAWVPVFRAALHPLFSTLGE